MNRTDGVASYVLDDQQLDHLVPCVRPSPSRGLGGAAVRPLVVGAAGNASTAPRRSSGGTGLGCEPMARMAVDGKEEEGGSDLVLIYIG